MKTEICAVPAPNDLKKEESTSNTELMISEPVKVNVVEKPKEPEPLIIEPPAVQPPTIIQPVAVEPIAIQSIEPIVEKSEKEKEPEQPPVEQPPQPQVEPEKPAAEPENVDEKEKTPEHSATASPENKESKPTPVEAPQIQPLQPIAPSESIPAPKEQTPLAPGPLAAAAAAAVPSNQIPPPPHAGELIEICQNVSRFIKNEFLCSKKNCCFRNDSTTSKCASKLCTGISTTTTLSTTGERFLNVYQ